MRYELSNLYWLYEVKFSTHYDYYINDMLVSYMQLQNVDWGWHDIIMVKWICTELYLLADAVYKIVYFP